MFYIQIIIAVACLLFTAVEIQASNTMDTATVSKSLAETIPLPGVLPPSLTMAILEFEGISDKDSTSARNVTSIEKQGEGNILNLPLPGGVLPLPEVLLPLTRVRNVLYQMFGSQFKMADEETCRRVFSIESQKKVSPLTPKRAAMLGRILDVDILVTGNYTIQRDGSFIINAAFISTHYENDSLIRLKLLSCLEPGQIIENNTESNNIGILPANKNKFLIVHAFAKEGTSGISVTNDINAEIYINEKRVGNSPLTIKNVPNSINLSIKKDAAPYKAQGELKNMVSGNKPFRHLALTQGYEPKHIAINLYTPDYCLLSLCLVDAYLSKETVSPVGSLLVVSEPNSALISLKQEQDSITEIVNRDVVPANKPSTLTEVAPLAEVALLAGVTPVVLPNLIPGFYEVKATKSGFKSQTKKVIIERGQQKRIYFDLERELPSLPSKKPCLELFSIQTNHLIHKDNVSIGVKYPELLIIRTGLPIEDLDFRVRGLGIGIKRKLTENLSLDLYYNGYNMRTSISDKDNASGNGGASIIFGSSLQLPFAKSRAYLGAGYYHEKNKDKSRYFGGLESHFTYDLALLLEYDKIDGSGIGIKYLLNKNIDLVFGIGKNKENKWRFDTGIFFEE